MGKEHRAELASTRWAGFWRQEGSQGGTASIPADRSRPSSMAPTDRRGADEPYGCAAASVAGKASCGAGRSQAHDPDHAVSQPGIREAASVPLLQPEVPGGRPGQRSGLGEPPPPWPWAESGEGMEDAGDRQPSPARRSGCLKTMPGGHSSLVAGQVDCVVRQKELR